MANSKILTNPGVRRYPRNQQEWNDLWNEIAKFFADSDDIADAKNAATSFRGEPGTTLWSTDDMGVYPAGNPTADLIANFYDSSGTVIASRTVEVTLTSAAGTIAVTDSAKATSGLTTTPTTVNDGTESVRIDVVLTLSDDSVVSGSLSANALDTTTASTTPANGGNK